MARVDNPRFDVEGVKGCNQCPLDYDKLTTDHGNTHCYIWHTEHDFVCPRNMEEYAEAVRMAEEYAHDAP